MNRDEQFEQRLSRQPMRAIPGEWRKEILSAAQVTKTAVPGSFGHQARAWWREFFSPGPRAWAGLGAAWVVILTLNLSAPDAAPSILRQNTARVGPRIDDAIRLKQQIIAELAGLADRRDADRPKAVIVRPRSEWRGDSGNA